MTNWLDDEQWHYYVVNFTSTTATVYLDGEVKNAWKVDGTSDGQVIDGLFTGGSNLKYICLGGNQAWNWNDADAPFMFDDLTVQNRIIPQSDQRALVANAKAAAEGTAIRQPKGVKTDGTVYNLNGQRVSGQLTKGIYVRDGKIIVVK